jgi:hypothetical protein
METKTTTIRGLLIDVLVVETTQTDAHGTLFYVANIVVKHRKNGAEKHVGKTRIVGSGQALARAVKRDGLRALQGFAA